MTVQVSPPGCSPWCRTTGSHANTFAAMLCLVVAGRLQDSPGAALCLVMWQEMLTTARVSPPGCALSVLRLCAQALMQTPCCSALIGDAWQEDWMAAWVSPPGCGPRCRTTARRRGCGRTPAPCGTRPTRTTRTACTRCRPPHPAAPHTLLAPNAGCEAPCSATRTACTQCRPTPPAAQQAGG